VIIEMMTAQTPWAERKFLSREQAMFFIGSSKEGPAIPKKLSAEGQDFVLRCLQCDPLERNSAKELLEHPWIVDLAIDRQFETMSLEPRRMGSFSTVPDKPRSYVPPAEVLVPHVPESAVGPLTNPTNPQSTT